jgi:subtilisin family serine protease
LTRTRPISFSLLLLAASATPIYAAPGAAAPASVKADLAPKVAVGHEAARHAPDRVIVQWKDANDVARKEHARGLQHLASIDGVHGPSVVGTNGASVEATVARLSKDAAVAWAEPDYVMQVAGTAVPVNDPSTSRQYSLDRMRVRDAWSLTTGGSRLVAVIDTGVQFNHPDLAGRISTLGYDFVNGDSNASDDNGHGTWVSGIIAAKVNNGVGVAGISWTDVVLPVKVMDETGHGYSSDVARGIDYAISKGAKVINMSIGGFEYSNAVKGAVDRAWAAGAVLVAAAGNYRTSQPSYPAAYDHVVSVSATQADDEFTNWSNYGATVDVSAPGAAVTTTNCTTSPCIHSTWGPTIDISGTSFATPNTAGVVALILARYPAYTNEQVVDRLLGTSDDLGFPGWDSRYGRGRVNAFRAVGGSVAAPAAQVGDTLERNDSATASRFIPFGTTHPNNYPAGDVDYFTFSAPRAGRISLAVSPVIDTTRPEKSSLSFDPVLDLWANGDFVTKVDDPSNSATVERFSYQATGPMTLTLRVRNWLPNGTKPAYTLTSAFVDNVGPLVTSRSPAPGATNVSRYPSIVLGFNEAVRNVSSASLRLRDATSGSLVSGTVTYDAAKRQAHLVPGIKLAADHPYAVEVTSALTDSAGNAITPVAWTITTGISGFSDTIGSPFEYDIAWLADSGITHGCGEDRFCPRDPVTREQMASFLARAMMLPATTRDFYIDDETSRHEDNINRLAAADITHGCGPQRFCPRGRVSRAQMASFLARALVLAPSTRDYFIDDEGSRHEASINSLAAAGITGGCSASAFCPDAVVTREQMAAFLHRAFGD